MKPTLPLLLTLTLLIPAAATGTGVSAGADCVMPMMNGSTSVTPMMAASE